MKILLINTGHIDIANQLVKKAKSRFLKKVLLVSRDRSTISKYHGKIPLLDYSRINHDRSQNALGIEKELMESLRDEYRKIIIGNGDIFLVTGCETPEIAALNVIQSICEETGTRFHVLFIAPFLFEGQKRSQLLKSMMESMSEYYDSISLYYPDELLRIQNSENKAVGQSFDLHKAYDALEEAAADLTIEMSKQIPKLNMMMQYTYDFEIKEFSLAIDRLGLLLNMWGSVSSDEANFRSSEENEEGLGVLEAAAGKVPVQTSKNIPKVGVFAPNKDKAKAPSAYKSVTRNSIPVGAYRKQINESSLDRLVEGIKELLSNEYNRPTDPEKRKKAQERLRREIEKFQVRQAEAEALHDGEQPTEVRGLDVALMEIYLDEGTEVEDEVPVTNDRVYMETPFQRAAKAAQNKEKPTSWVQIKADRDAANVNEARAEEPQKQIVDTVSEGPIIVGAPESGSHKSSVAAPVREASQEATVTNSEATPAPDAHIDETAARQDMTVKRVADFIHSTADKTVEDDEDNSSSGAMFYDISQEISVKDGAESSAVPKSTHKYLRGEGTRLNVKESAKKPTEQSEQDDFADDGLVSRREGRQRDKLNKKLAKAEEKAEAARRRAEAALREATEAAKEVELIAKKREEEE